MACDKLEKADKSMKAVQDMNKKMDETNGQMSEMKRLLAIGDSLHNYGQVQNYDIVDPIPLKLGPWAKTIAENMNKLELVQFAQTELKLVNEGKTLKNVNDDGERIPFTTQEKAKLNDQKRLRVTFLEMIAGFLPAGITDQLIQEAKNGAFAPTARKILMLRYAFIKDFEFSSAKMGETFLNVAMAQAAFDELDKADYLARVDVDNTYVFETTGLKRITNSEDEEDPNYHWSIDREDLKSSWSALLNRLDTDMQATENGAGAAKPRDVTQARHIESLKSQIQARLEFWNKNTATPAVH
jgi:hypothetical protein